MARIDRLILCDCEGSMALDPETAARASGAAEVIRASRLCTDEIERAAKALSAGGRTLVACGQMAARFADLAEELEAEERLVTADIRDRAGWTADGKATAKQAALLAEAALEAPMTPMRDVVSQGTCLVLGGAAAIAAGRRLADSLAVTVLIDPEEMPEAEDLVPTAAMDVGRGRLSQATGALGGFSVVVENFASLEPGGRTAGRFGAPTARVSSACDIILDLRARAAPLFPAPHKRDGYLRADPRDPAAVERAVFDAAGLQGEFEKTLYVRFDAQLCAHSRAGQQGCTRCLDICPTGAISPDGDHVTIDPLICAGCGGCAAVCPSGAASYDDPPVGFLFARLRALAGGYRAAGGGVPRLLVHDGFGAEMIRLSARFGRGLPADVIPFEVNNVEGFGHAEMLAALGVGFGRVTLLAAPDTDMTVPDRELALARALGPSVAEALAILAPASPDALEEALYPAPRALVAPLPEPVLPAGSRREVARLVAGALAVAAEAQESVLPLPEGAPYGAVEIDTDACTLCLACVSLCPSGALLDNPDKPQVSFQEAACLQCGICARACPESAIRLTPRMWLDPDALGHRVLNEEEPFECISCGKPFGVRSTIERIVEKLEGKHRMFTGSDNVKLIQMCDDCRVRAQFHQENAPFFLGERPKPRTTDDYLDERKKPN